MKDKTKIVCVIFFLGLILTTLASIAEARIYIDITQPFAKKLPLATPDFMPIDPLDSPVEEVGHNLAVYLSQNLDLTGLFVILSPGSFLELDKRAGLTASDPKIEFKDWLNIGDELLIKGAYKIEGQELTLELRLYDVYEETMLFGKRYKRTLLDGPAMINRFINEIMALLTDERGVMGSSIIFIGSHKNSNNENIGDIYLNRFGDSEIIKLTSVTSRYINPVLSRLGDEMAYISYKAKRPNLYIKRLTENSELKLSSDGSMLLSPMFAPENQLWVAMSQKNATNIAAIDRTGKILSMQTDGLGINMSPTISPDGTKFAFVSDRSGSPQIYISPIGGLQPLRLTFDSNYNTDPQWSPKGDKIVYVTLDKDKKFNIYTIKPDGSERQQLTYNAGDNLRPTWSPDGRLIVFSSNRFGKYMLFTMTSTGEKQKALPIKFDGQMISPYWSPVRND